MMQIILGKRIGKKIISIIPVYRCNAVKFESNVCEEAKVMHLEDIDVGQAEKSFLLRSEDAK